MWMRHLHEAVITANQAVIFLVSLPFATKWGQLNNLECVVTICAADICHEPMANIDYRDVAANVFVRNHAFIYIHNTFPHDGGQLS